MPNVVLLFSVFVTKYNALASATLFLIDIRTSLYEYSGRVIETIVSAKSILKTK